MRLVRLYVVIAAIVTAELVTSGCQAAHRQSAVLPPAHSSPPALQPATTSNVPTADRQVPTSNAGATGAPTIRKGGSDPAAELIERVEKEYQDGLESYRAGHPDAAKQSFDRAFNLLLGSNLEVGSDDRLQRELEKILEGTNGLELMALQEGDGSQEQRSEPAPIDEANEATFPVDPNIKAKAEAEIKSTHSDLPLMMTDQVAGYINYFSDRGRGVLERGLSRSGRYEEMIERTLKQEGVPEDLIYLAQAESGFQPLALSRAGARGMWQFMASRARAYDLHRDWWVDERQDPEKSTRAAARHLKDLYTEFGDWYLAMAAYNSGPGTVQSAVKRTGYADFWELYRRNVLPKETRNYVPIILAVAIMAKNPEQYGLDQVEKQKPTPDDVVRINYPVDLRLVAECVDVPVADLQDFNPSLLRMTTPKGEEFELHLPAGTKDKYLSAIAAIPPDMRVWWRYHRVQAGETLASLGRSYRTTPTAIAEANAVDGQELQAGQKLIIPILPGKHAAEEDVVSYSRRATRYRIRKGDTVQSVADDFGVPAKMVRQWNHIRGNSLQGRSVLYVHLPVTPNSREARIASEKSSKSKQKKTMQAANQHAPVVHHKVKQGETLYSIASSYNTTVTALKRDNRNVATLRPGMILVIRELP